MSGHQLLDQLVYPQREQNLVCHHQDHLFVSPDNRLKEAWTGYQMRDMYQPSGES